MTNQSIFSDMDTSKLTGKEFDLEEFRDRLEDIFVRELIRAGLADSRKHYDRAYNTCFNKKLSKDIIGVLKQIAKTDITSANVLRISEGSQLDIKTAKDEWLLLFIAGLEKILSEITESIEGKHPEDIEAAFEKYSVLLILGIGRYGKIDREAIRHEVEGFMKDPNKEPSDGYFEVKPPSGSEVPSESISPFGVGEHKLS